MRQQLEAFRRAACGCLVTGMIRTLDRTTCSQPGTSSEEKSAGKYDLYVGVVHWETRDDIAFSISATLEQLGCRVTVLSPYGRLPEKLDVVLAWGPMKSLVPLTNQLLSSPASSRPLFALWLTEQLTNPLLPDWIRCPAAFLRSQAERWAFHRTEGGGWSLYPYLGWVAARGRRFRYYGDLCWLRRKGLLHVLAVGSQWIAGQLRGAGFDPVTAYLGAPSNWGADLGLERDIPVLWIGKVATRRRRRVLDRVRGDLRNRGIEMRVVDGVENPGVYGMERTILLNRTVITVNILRTPWDNHSVRCFIAAPNRVLIVSEPTLQHTPFVPGEHLVAVDARRMADTICHYLSHEAERQHIVENAYRLVIDSLTMKHGVSQILKRIVEVRERRHTPAELH